MTARKSDEGGPEVVIGDKPKAAKASVDVQNGPLLILTGEPDVPATDTTAEPEPDKG